MSVLVNASIGKNTKPLKFKSNIGWAHWNELGKVALSVKRERYLLESFKPNKSLTITNTSLTDWNLCCFPLGS